jgi:hypothetical protein
MNRNQVYDYLKGIDELKPLFYKYGRGYNVRFVPKVWVKFTQIIINDWYIENFYSITLLIQEMIIQGETSDMEIHIRYNNIDKFDVQLEEGYKIKK